MKTQADCGSRQARERRVSAPQEPGSRAVAAKRLTLFEAQAWQGPAVPIQYLDAQFTARRVHKQLATAETNRSRGQGAGILGRHRSEPVAAQHCEACASDARIAGSRPAGPR